MNVSPAGVRLIASFEGFVPHWYNDGTGVMTIGFGHTGPLPAGFHAPLTVDEGLQLLGHDVRYAEQTVTSTIKVRLALFPSRTQARFDALVSLAFNIGGSAFQRSSLARAVNAKGAPRNWTSISPLWLEWDHANGQVLPGLLTRRREELGLFLTCRYPT